MNAVKSNYFDAYRSLKLTRDACGVLVAEFHSNGGSFIISAQAHTEFVDAFYLIAQDRANKIVIMTEQAGTLLLMSLGRLSATSPIPASGAKFTTRASRLWKTSPIYVCPSLPRSRDAPMCTQITRYSLV